MPYKARYWKNPDHHRKEARERSGRLTKLGYKGGHRKYSTYLQMCEWIKRWVKTPKGRASRRAATKKYEAKIHNSGFSISHQGKFLYKLWIDDKKQRQKDQQKQKVTKVNNGRNSSQHAEGLLSKKLTKSNLKGPDDSPTTTSRKYRRYPMSANTTERRDHNFLWGKPRSK